MLLLSAPAVNVMTPLVGGDNGRQVITSVCIQWESNIHVVGIKDMYSICSLWLHCTALSLTLTSWLTSTPCSSGPSISDHTSPGCLSNKSISSVTGVGGCSSPTQGDSMCARGDGDCSIAGLGQ